MIRGFLTKHQLELSFFDGCMYGLIGRSGVPLLKPWCVATNSCLVRDTLNIRCKGDHIHDRTSGVDAKTSEGYSEYMVECVHRTFGLESARRHLGTPVPGGGLSPAMCCSSGFHPDSLSPARVSYIHDSAPGPPVGGSACPPCFHDILPVSGCTRSGTTRLIACLSLVLRVHRIIMGTRVPGSDYVRVNSVFACLLLTLNAHLVM